MVAPLILPNRPPSYAMRLLIVQPFPEKVPLNGWDPLPIGLYSDSDKPEQSKVPPSGASLKYIAAVLIVPLFTNLEKFFKSSAVLMMIGSAAVPLPPPKEVMVVLYVLFTSPGMVSSILYNPV